MTPIAPDLGRAAARPLGWRPGGGPAGSKPRGRTPRRETALCVTLSAALHFAALAAFAMIAPSGEPSGGSGGAMAVTLVGSDAALAALAEAWAPPDEAARPDPAASPEPVASPEPAPTPLPITSAAAPAPAAADPVTQPSQEPPPAASPPRDGMPPLPPVTPRDDPVPPATVAEPAPRPRPTDLRHAPSAVAAAPTRSAPRADARETSRAAGTGAAQVAGSQGSADVSTGAVQAQASAMRIWGAQIQRTLQSGLPVPRGMERATRDLRIVLALSVAPDGRLRAAEVLRSSGDAALDAEALRSVRRIGRLPRAPRGMSGPAYDFVAPIDLTAP